MPGMDSVREHGGVRRRLLVVTAATILLAAACGGGDEEGTDTGGTNGTPSPSAPAAAAPVQITMLEYGFAVSGTPTSGGTMRLANTGRELHMLSLMRLKEGKSAQDLVPAMQIGDEEARQAAMNAIAEEIDNPYQGLFGPGTVELPLTLEPANYAMLCFVPTVGDGAPHAFKGMINELRVVGGETAGAPEPSATYTVSAGKALEGPTNLQAGRNVIAFQRGDGAGSLEPTVSRPADGRTFEDLAGAVFRVMSGDPPPAAGYLDTLPGTLPVSLSNFGETDRVWVALDLSPGEYVFAGIDTDREQPNLDPPEKITVVVS